MATGSPVKTTLTWLRCVVSLILHPRMPVYRLEGESSIGHLRVMVVDDGSALPVVMKLAFDGQVATRRVGRVWAFSAHKLARVDADLLVVGARRLFLGRFVQEGFYLTPRWIRLATDLTEDPDTLISRLPGPYKNSVARLVDKAKSKGFTFETTTDPKWLYPFYHSMYKPNTLKRHGKAAVVYSYKSIGTDFKRGCMLLIKKDNDVVAGAILGSRGDAMRFIHAGVLDGSDDLLKEGVSNAMYYFMFQKAYQSGYKRLDLGLCRPFLTDGITRYKLKWGGVLVQEDIGTGAFAITAPGRTEAGNKFLQANPFFHWRSGVTLPPQDSTIPTE